MTPRLRRSIVFGIVTLALSTLAVAQEPREGLVVLDAPKPASAEESLPQPGDVLLSWRRGDASGVLRWPSGLAEAEIEQAPRGLVMLLGRRGGMQMSWRMPAAAWNLRTRPALGPHFLALYREGAEWFANGQPEKGAESWRAAVDAADRAGDKPRAAWFLGELGRAWTRLGQTEEADAAYEEAIRRMERSSLGASLLREWGATFVQRRLWSRAETCYRRALAQAPRESYAAAHDLAMLAIIASHEGDLDRAERSYRQALTNRKRIAPLGPYLVPVIQDEVRSFGTPRYGRDPQELDTLRRRLEQLRETLLAEAGISPARPGTSSARTATAAPPKKESPLEQVQKALAKAERESPGSLAVSDRWQELGGLAFESGDLVAAEIAWLRALDIREKLATGTLRDARTLHDLGRVHRKAGRQRVAASFFCRAAASLDRLGRMPVDEDATRSMLGAEPGAYDRDCMAALVATNRPEKAFLALERSRVRGATLALSPQSLRRRNDIDADRAQALIRLGLLSTSRDRDEIDELLDYTGELEAQRNAIAGPLDLDGIRAALPEKTVLLAWSIGDEESFLFVVQPAGAPGAGVNVHSIRSGAEALWKRVDAFAAQAGTVETGPGPMRAEAAELYRLLLGPVSSKIAEAEKLLVLPDDILAPLPFGSLVRGEELLGKQKAIETDISATAWAARRRPSPQASLP